MANLEILTPQGWSDFDGVRRSLADMLVVIETASGKQIRCTPNHLILCGSDTIQAIDADIGMSVNTSSGIEEISSVDHVVTREEVFDALDVKKQHLYYTNGIVSHNCQFIGSSGTLIRGDVLKALVAEDPIKTNAGLRIYHEPEEGHTYAIVCDVSRGKGLDYSAFSVIDITEMPYRQVAVYRHNMVTPVQYSEVIYRTARQFNDAVVLIEINDIGGQVADTIFSDFEYDNVLGTKNNGRAGKVLESDAGGVKGEAGIRTTKAVKNVGCSMLKMLVEQQQLIVVDENAIFELSVFAQRRNSYEAEPGQHDDVVMGLVLFAWMTKDPMFAELTSINTLAELRDQPLDSDEDVIPFGTVYNGKEDDDAHYEQDDTEGAMWSRANALDDEMVDIDSMDDALDGFPWLP